MIALVKGSYVDVSVDDSGYFFIKSQPNVRTTTLKGLQNKLNGREVVKLPGKSLRIPVEHADSGMLGEVIAKGQARYTNSYKVKWADGKVSTVEEFLLVKPMGPINRTSWEELKKDRDAKSKAYDEAEDAVEAFEEEFNVSKTLREAYNNA